MKTKQKKTLRQIARHLEKITQWLPDQNEVPEFSFQENLGKVKIMLHSPSLDTVRYVSFWDEVNFIADGYETNEAIARMELWQKAFTKAAKMLKADIERFKVS